MRRADLRRLARETIAKAPKLAEGEAHLALGLYRLLARGEPVDLDDLAAATGTLIETARGSVDQWPGVYRDPEGRIVGFWGLALSETEHRFQVDGPVLYAWCAFDTLFLPRILGASARVTSQDGEDGSPIDLDVGPDGVARSEPESVVLTFVGPGEGPNFDGDVISNFCHHIRFFVSRDSATRWIGDRSDVTVLSLEQGVELARRWVAALYGDVLAAP